MNRKRGVRYTVVGVALLFWTWSSATGFGFLLPRQEGPVGEKHRPVVEAIAARNEIRDGDLWKIYIRATDPDGDLDKIYITFSQQGADFSPELLPQKDMVREINGYILVWAALNGGFQAGDIFGYFDIRVEDRAGNMSEPKSFSFTVSQFEVEDKFVPPAGFNTSNQLGQADFPLLTDAEVVGDDKDD